MLSESLVNSEGCKAAETAIVKLGTSESLVDSEGCKAILIVHFIGHPSESLVNSEGYESDASVVPGQW